MLNSTLQIYATKPNKLYQFSSIIIQPEVEDEGDRD